MFHNQLIYKYNNINPKFEYCNLQGIGLKFCHLQRESAGGRTVSRQQPAGDRWVTLRHCSRSRKSADELPISQNRHPAKIERALQDLCFLGTSAIHAKFPADALPMSRRRSHGGPAVTTGGPVDRCWTTMNPAVIGRSPFGDRAAIAGSFTGVHWVQIWNWFLIFTCL